MADVAQHGKKVTAEIVTVDPAIEKDDSRFVEDLGASSMERVELAAAFRV